jgi:adenine phosphoribosyltransferase
MINNLLIKKIKQSIVDFPNFPKKGLIFKDISKILLDMNLFKQIISILSEQFINKNIDMICGIDSRGFLFGPSIAQYLNIPFVMIRKKGKLPGQVISQKYKLEYGEDIIEIDKNYIKRGANVIIHDDILATGGTSEAAALLLHQLHVKSIKFLFLLQIKHLNGKNKLLPYSKDIFSCVDV